MTRAIVVLVVLVMTGAASADHRILLDPRIALAVERDGLLPLEPTSVVVQPRADVVAPIDHARLWQVVDVTALALSTAALAVDWRQTRGAAAEGWSHSRGEVGVAAMTVGEFPSAGTVDRYFAATAAVNVALWAVLPRGWRSVVPGFVIGAEIVTVRRNLPTTHL